MNNNPTATSSKLSHQIYFDTQASLHQCSGSTTKVQPWFVFGSGFRSPVKKSIFPNR